MEHIDHGNRQAPGAGNDGCLALNTIKGRLAVADLKTPWGPSKWDLHTLELFVVNGMSLFIPLEGGFLTINIPLGCGYKVDRAALPGEMKVELLRQLPGCMAGVNPIGAGGISSLDSGLLQLQPDVEPGYWLKW